jgi:hypothetical protein
MNRRVTVRYRNTPDNRQNAPDKHRAMIDANRRAMCADGACPYGSGDTILQFHATFATQDWQMHRAALFTSLRLARTCSGESGIISLTPPALLWSTAAISLQPQER